MFKQQQGRLAWWLDHSKVEGDRAEEVRSVGGNIIIHDLVEYGMIMALSKKRSHFTILFR